MIFGIFKDKVAEKVAQEIDNTLKKLYSLAKKDKIGMDVIDKKVFESEFNNNNL